MRLKVERIQIPEGRRILAVSGIHAQTGLFRELMKQAGFCDGDELFICGDILEKGRENHLEVLRFFMRLSERKNVHILMGNCDALWEDIEDDDPENDAPLLHYMLFRPRGLLQDMCAALGITAGEGMDMPAMKRLLRASFRPELEWLSKLPQIIDTQRLTFVHGGLATEALESHSAWQVMKYDNFLEQGTAFSKWVVAGHWPVENYTREIGCANPIVNREQRIAAIDGGNALRPGGQLNCLLLPDIRSEEFSFVAVDGLEELTITHRQKASPDPHFVVWTESAVDILEEGEEFSLCRQTATGRKILAANDMLFRERDGALRCAMGTDYLLPVEPGERVKVIRRYRTRALCKKDGCFGYLLFPEASKI